MQVRKLCSNASPQKTDRKQPVKSLESNEDTTAYITVRQSHEEETKGNLSGYPETNLVVMLANRGEREDWRHKRATKSRADVNNISHSYSSVPG
jgi:hypothetical protein